MREDAEFYCLNELVSILDQITVDCEKDDLYDACHNTFEDLTDKQLISTASEALTHGMPQKYKSALTNALDSRDRKEIVIALNG